MKPQLLTMQAFGCYLKETQVDFSLLQNKIFLITGATGGGKTTLLDAICFALYCRATGGKRSWSDMRSISAPEKQETFVDFSFSLGEMRYRFRRSMRMHRVRGSDRLEPREEHACWQWKDGDWSLLLSGAESKVREQAQRLLGLTCEQFSQVVVLPQGEFRKLLLSNSTEKARIFQTLFQTERWEQIARTAQKCAEEQKKELDSIFGSRELLLQREEAGSLDEVEQKKRRLQEEYQKYTEQCLQVEEQLQKARGEYSASALLEEQFQNREKAAKELIALQHNQEVIHRNALRLEEAKRYNRLQPYDRSICQEKQRTTDKRERLLQAQRRWKLAEDERVKAEQLAQTLPKLRQQWEHANKEAVLLEAAEKNMEKLLAFEQKIIVLQRQSKELEAVQKKEQATREKAAENVRIGEQFVQELTAQQQNTAELAARLASLKDLAQQYDLLKERKAKYQQTEKNYQEALKKSHAAEVTLVALRTQLDSVQAVLHQDLAASFTEGLTEGMPCPVCGSLHHPALGKRPHEIPEEKQVEYLKEAFSRQEQETAQLTRALAAAEALCNAERQGYEQQRKICEKIPMELGQIQKELAQQEQALCTAKAAQEKLPRAQALLKRRKQEEKDAGEAEERCIQQLQDLRRQMAQEEAGKTAVASAIPQSCPTQQKLAEKRRETAQQMDVLRRQIDTIEQETLQKQKEAASMKEKEQAAQEAYEEAQKRLEEAQHQYEAQCKLLEISPKEPLQDKFLSPERMVELEKEQKEYHEQLHAAHAQKRELDSKLEGAQRPNLAKQEETLLQLQQYSSEIAQRSGVLRSECQETEKTFTQLRKLANRGEKLEQEYSHTARIAQLLGGGNLQKVPIKMFVLGIMLGDILCRANLYFTTFSAGRYRLSRPENTGGGRGYNGLELVVEDGFSGGSRAVETLSGGELFLASLSLAFGLSDVVQAYSGGVRLDSIFIDEGFGSLDQETLDTAMKALDAIQRTGRTVGIISHVQELKARISSKIEVVSQQDGQSRILVHS